MNYWFKILYITALSRWTLTPTSAEFTAGSCSFSSYNRVAGYILRGNVVSEYNVPHGIECRKICEKAANCLSVNLFKKSETSFLCQLNKARKENSHSEQFVKIGGEGEYFGVKKKSLWKSKSQGCISETPWHSFNRSNFMFVTTKMTWKSAREYCLKENGDLASISSDEEFQFICETFLKKISQAYIGLNDINSEGNFEWSDGTPVMYSKFKTGEPNNYGGVEDCIIIHKEKFNDDNCDKSLPFLCEAT